MRGRQKSSKTIIPSQEEFSSAEAFIQKRKKIDSGKGLRPRMDGVIERLKAKDPAFAGAIKAVENHWLSEANTVLYELIELVRDKAKGNDVGMNDLLKAIEVISDKYNLHVGVPTSNSVVTHVTVNEKSDEILEKEIYELQKYIDFKEGVV